MLETVARILIVLLCTYLSIVWTIAEMRIEEERRRVMSKSGFVDSVGIGLFLTLYEMIDVTFDLVRAIRSKIRRR